MTNVRPNCTAALCGNPHVICDLCAEWYVATLRKKAQRIEREPEYRALDPELRSAVAERLRARADEAAAASPKPF